MKWDQHFFNFTSDVNILVKEFLKTGAMLHYPRTNFTFQSSPLAHLILILFDTTHITHTLKFGLAFGLHITDALHCLKKSSSIIVS